MARSLNIPPHVPKRARIFLLAFLCAAGAVAGSVATRPSGAASSINSIGTHAATGLPWWKKTLSHTVQEEWAFAQMMEQQYGPRWRTALPDKVVLKLYQEFCAELPHP
ncbi:MAG: hypothetical protein K8R92_07255 [Planctomycetes bacterium]|nr:hypothetical protein [Planctomycetota bacterium]